MIGQTVSHYRILEKLGAGGMGEVFLADDTRLHRKVALKFLPAASSSDPDARERLLREARAASRLHHPNIVTIHSIEEEGGQYFIVMEHVEGVPLSRWVLEEKPDPERLVGVFQETCKGLQHAHSAGIVHRDLKPENILVERDGRVRILDFGVARQSGTPRLTQTGSMIGTMAYVSPEQIQGKEAGPQSDLFSLGVLMYELLSGQKPFAGEHEAAVLYSIAHEEPKPLRSLNARVSPDVERVVARCLAKSPEDRFASADEVTRALSSLPTTTPSRHVILSDPAAGAKPSIAVLPFVNMSADPENEYFSDGLAEELINALGKIKELRVVARTSAFSFKGKDTDVREIGRRLDVKTLLEGSVRTSGKKLRVTAQLVKCDDGDHLWSERFDREMHDVFEIQDEITQAIVLNLKLRLLKGAEGVIGKHQTENAEALALYMKGRYFWNKRTEDGFKRSVDCYQQALAIDPDYAMAHVGLADTYNLFGFYHLLAPREAFVRSRQEAEKALALDPQSARALASLAYSHYYYDWDLKRAEEVWLLAKKLEPSYPYTYVFHANLLTASGRLAEGLADLQRAREIDPLSSIINAAIGWNRYFARDYDASIKSLAQDTLELDPSFLPARIWLGRTLEVLGRLDEAREQFEEALRASEGSHVAMAGRARTLALAGKVSESRQILSQLEISARERYVSSHDLALVLLALGDEEGALNRLEQALQERCPDLLWMKMDPRFDGIRLHPRFAKIVTTVGVPG